MPSLTQPRELLGEPLVGVGDEAAAAVDRHRVVMATQQRAQGHPQQLRLQVPESDVKRGDRHRAQPRTPVVADRVNHRSPGRLHVERVAAVDRRRELGLDQLRDRGVAVGPAEARHPSSPCRRDHQRGRVPGERSVGLGGVGRDRVRAGLYVADRSVPCHAATRLCLSSCAQRSASAMITSAGFAAPCVGNTLPSTINRFGTSHTRWLASTTLSSGEKPIRAPPTRCAKRSILS